MSIQVLSPQLASQIAAGEVIERPASVLKELLENSIDAGSQHIEVRILKSGIQQIYVQDDGKGISLEDFPLVFSPHATSKIASMADLEKLLSYGFRGEALASIASVAKVTLTARTADCDMGHRLLADFKTQAPTIISIPCSIGTTLDVQDLFYNTPARRKFLKSDKTEWMHLEQTFKHAALSCPAVSFTLFHHGKVVYRLPACTDKALHLNRIKQFSGTSFVEQALELAAVVDDLRLWGWVAPPNPLQKTGPLHYFFINGRAIKDKVVTHALQKAFLSVFPHAVHNTMAYVLYFELDPEQMDINVHPAKQEVRFREPRRVHAFLTQTIESALRQEFFDLPASPQPISTEPLMPKHQSLTPSEDSDDNDLSYQPFGLSAFQRKPSTIPALKSRGAGIQKQPIPPHFKTALGEPLCVIRDRWLLSDNGETLFLIDIRLATQALTGACTTLPFFSLQAGIVLIRQLEAQFQTGQLDPDSVAVKCAWPIGHKQPVNTEVTDAR